MPLRLAIALGLCALAAPAPLAAQEIVIGTSATYPPMIVHDGTPPVSGLEGDLLAALCDRAGWTCRWEIMPFDVIFPALDVGRIDIAANSLGYTAERALRVHMTCPYRPSGEDGSRGTLWVLDPDHDPYAGPIAVVRDTLHTIALADEGADMRLFSDDNTALDAVVAGEIPAYFGPDPAIEAYPNSEALFAAGHLAIPSGGTSFAVTPLRPALAEEVDALLANLSQEGVITDLTRRWTGGGVDDPIALCNIQQPIS